MGALEKQVGSDHYKKLGIQPFELTLANFGYAGLRAAVYTKVNKYLARDKGSHIQDIEKAIHCLEIQLEAAKAHEAKTQTESDADQNMAHKDPNQDLSDPDEGWIENTEEVDPKLEAETFYVRAANGYRELSYSDSSAWVWAGDSKVTHYRVSKKCQQS